MDTIKVSVIIPVYNTSLYLEKCLRTVMNQSLKEIEIICVNDGSTDNSLEILERLQKEDNRIIIINKKNGGSSSARNTGLKIVKGEYIIHIDSDDWIDNDYLKSLYETAKKNDLDIVVSDFINEIKNKFNHIIERDILIEENEICTGKEAMTIFLSSGLGVAVWNKLIKKDLYKNNNMFFNKEIFFNYEDINFMYKITYYANRVGRKSKKCYHYRIGENNGSQLLKLVKIKDALNAFSDLKNFYKKSNEIELLKLIMRKEIMILTNLFIQFEINEKQEENEYEEILNIFLNLIKEHPFILTKKIKESIKIIILFNLIKIFPNKYSFYILKKLYKFFRKLKNYKRYKG